ncbi:DegT/DnrJ/EryC1/StrS family aminotransferase [Bacillus fungorum]|uniref:Aminotransferase n=1 Tax=Bacillus fungorum TaxID=2039284 RepID=A0A2G6QGN4_9BACI|nr:DegT/DnrJ/EryC1/StrS family aminotransferase [Bacillus fungorum]PIE96002.1 aminotransferase [Bacillus fungorum]
MENITTLQKQETFPEPILVSRPFLPPFQEYADTIQQLWDTHYITNNGSFHQQFEKELQSYLSVPHNTLFVNGHMALDIAIKSLQIQGEVITTPFTFVSTTHAIVMNGLTPVFCDIREDDYNIDVTKIEALITERTSAILPVHVFGRPCNVVEIERIAKKYNLKVIYDAAHAFGVRVNGTSIGTFGDVCMFSMHATKIFHSIEGGILTYHNPHFTKVFNQYKNFGIYGPENVELIGLNGKMNEFQAAMGLINLNYISEEIKKRKKITQIYREYLQHIPGIRYVDDEQHVKYNYSYFSIEIDEHCYGNSRDELYEKLKGYNVFTRKYFYPLTSDFTCYHQQFDSWETPIAKQVAERILVLPLYGALSLHDAKKICNIIAEIHYDKLVDAKKKG